MKNASRNCALKFNVLAKVIKVLFGALITIMLTGCGDSAYPELKEDANCDFLIEYVVDSNDLTEPFVWRAEDTKGIDIELPKHVVPTEWYEKIWE